MAIKTYSLKVDGNRNLIDNFKVKEFSCPGSDAILIDDALVVALQKVRDHFAQPVTITSGYRAEAWNKKIGGSPSSQHLLGKAADIVAQGVTPLAVARYAESMGMGGVGHYTAGQGNEYGFQ